MYGYMYVCMHSTFSDNNVYKFNSTHFFLKAFSLRFWPKIKQLHRSLRLNFLNRHFSLKRVKINYKTKQLLGSFSTVFSKISLATAGCVYERKRDEQNLWKIIHQYHKHWYRRILIQKYRSNSPIESTVTYWMATSMGTRVLKLTNWSTLTIHMM